MADAASRPGRNNPLLLESRNQWPTLALLRFILAAIVVAGHYALLIHPDPWGLFGGGLLNPGSAVYGFFVLSGYSIAASIGRESTHFLRRRVIRIWPLYLSCIAFAMLMWWAHPAPFIWPLGGITAAPTLRTILTSLFMLQTIVGDPIPILGPTWSLSAEWWHYTLSPLLKKLPTWVLALFGAGSLYCLLNIPGPPGRGIEGYPHGEAILVTSWFWMSGFIYYRLRSRPLGFVVLVFPSVLLIYLGGFVGMPTLCTLIALILSSEFSIPTRATKFADWLGDLSFPLYLFHVPALVLMLTLGVKNVVLVLCGPFAIACAALYLVDYPSRRLIPIIFKKRGADSIDCRDVPLASDLAAPQFVETAKLASID